MPEKPKPVLELSRREEVIVKAYAENFFEFGKIHWNDPRDQIYQNIVVSKFGSYDTAGERMTPTPLWDIVFGKNFCPYCNTPVDMVRNNVAGRLEKKDDSYVCNNCQFKITAELFNKANDRNKQEIAWFKKDAELRDKMSKDKIGKKRVSELAELGERKAMSMFERMLKDEKKS